MEIGAVLIWINGFVQTGFLGMSVGRLAQKKSIACLVVFVHVCVSVAMGLVAGNTLMVACHGVPALYLSTLLWDSRLFNIESFSYKLVYKRIYMLIFPISVLICSCNTTLEINWIVILGNCVANAVLAETIYPALKRSGRLRQTTVSPLAARRILVYMHFFA